MIYPPTKKKKEFPYFLQSHEPYYFVLFIIWLFCFIFVLHDMLESTDAAPGVPHPRPTRRPTRLPARRTISGFFFFFSRIRADSARFAPMRLDSCRIGFDSRRIGLIRPKSGRIGHIGTYRPAADTVDTAETGRKTAETGRNRPETAEIGLEYGCKIRNLHSSFFFCESRPSMCF